MYVRPISLFDRSQTRTAWCLLGAVWAAGCCHSVIPDVEKYFDRTTSTSALLGFVYAVETGNWDYAFASLDSSSRKAIETPDRLDWAVYLGRDPDFDLPLRDVIVESIRWRSPPMPYDGRADVHIAEVVYVDPETDEELIFLDIYLVMEEGAWRVDLMTTIQRNYGDILQSSQQG